MYCPQCGTELPGEALFCFSCGEKVPLESRAEAPAAKAARRRSLPHLADLCLAAAAIYAFSQIGSIYILAPWGTALPLRRITAPGNALHWTQGVMALGLFLLRVPIWRRIKRPGIWKSLPAAAATAASALALGACFLRTSYHADADAAGEAFAAVVASGAELSTSNDIIFGKAPGSRAHMASITPDLGRALEARGVSVNRLLVRESECVAPGWTPIAAVALLLVLARRRAFDSSSALSGLFLAYGIVNSYVIAWFAAAQAGGVMEELKVNPLWFGAALWLLALSAVFLAAAHRRIGEPKENDLPPAESLAVYFATSILAVAGVYFVSFKSPGNPAGPWAAAYWLASALLWRNLSRQIDGAKG